MLEASTCSATMVTRSWSTDRKPRSMVTVSLPELALADRPLVVVVGSEGKGLSRLVRQTCDQIVSIPMSGATESLNAGIAAAVSLYAIAQHRS